MRISKIARAADHMMFAVNDARDNLAARGPERCAGESASFSVKATGAPELFDQWRLYGTNVPGATSATYSIAAAQSTDAGPYNVVIKNTYDTAISTVATLTVGPAVTITSPTGSTRPLRSARAPL